MDYEAILFDLDGVIVRGAQTPRSVYDRATRETVTEFDLDEELLDVLTSPSSSTAVRDALSDHDADHDAVWRHREERASAIANERIADGRRERYPDVDAIERLSGRCALGVVSNNRHGTVDFVCDYFGLADALDTWHGRSPTLDGWDRMKPDPHYLHRALDDVSVDPDSGRALYVGDRPSDLRAAANAGMDGAFLRRSHNEDHLNAVTGLADHVLDRLDDLTDQLSAG